MTIFSERYKIRRIDFVYRFSYIILRIVQLTMVEQFHLLDLQIANFTEFGVRMVFPGVAELNHLRNSCEKLAEWAILGARINQLVSLLPYVQCIYQCPLNLYYRIMSVDIASRV